MDIISVVEQKGYWKVSKMTKPDTYRTVHKSSFDAGSLHVRDNVGWAVAELIIVDELCTAEEESHILERWAILVDGDPVQPSTQKLILTNDGTTYKLYDSMGKVISKDILEHVIPSPSRKIVSSSHSLDAMPPQPLQLITYGAPGTGKSFGVKDETKEKAFFRTTFHPDSDYASFVGAYKPTMRAVERTALVGKKLEMADVESVKDALKKEEVICYEFVAQTFTQAYVQAWRFQSSAAAGAAPQRVYLVIEEINRGNCAQVFGDLFQLLDRNDDGFSDYPIRPDADLGTFLGAAFASAAHTFDAARKKAINAPYPEMGGGIDVVDEVLAGRLMVLPSNLLLRATMNTSDQSLFPMDSAFKRRWDWQYVPIVDKNLGWTISAAGVTFGWWNFLAAVNGQIAATLKSADKQLGYFFVRPDDDSGKVISAARFVSKVLFFLYNDVFKDYVLPKAFAKPEGGTFAFGDFFLSDGAPDESAVQVFLSQLLTPSAA